MWLEQEEMLASVANMDEYEFEHLIADLWKRRGWNTTVTSGSNDRGIDVIAEKHSPFYQKQLIQAKCFAHDNTIGSPDIQQYSSLRHQENGVDAVVVVTTSSFSRQATEIATDLNVKLIDGNTLYDLITEYGREELLKEYVALPSRTEKTAGEQRPDTRSGEGRQDTTEKDFGQEFEQDSEQEFDDWNISNENNDSSNSLIEILLSNVGPKSRADRPPYRIPESTYHNKNWKRTKLAVVLPFVLFAGALVAALTRGFVVGPYGEINFSTTPFVHVLSVLFMTSLVVSPFIFLIYASRDKKAIHEATSRGTPRHPITIAVFAYFTAGIYILWHLIARIRRYEVAERHWNELEDQKTSESERESEESTDVTRTKERFPDSNFFDE